jgi:hypothetical protein|tara:strand:+ start:175 stop:792 length:618 start_codon:yes stop_codon:yes gene_type:complete
MKKRIKITRRLIKEAIEDVTMPPQGGNIINIPSDTEKIVRTPTEMISAEELAAAMKNPKVVEAPDYIKAELQKAHSDSKQDPTQKMRITDRLKTWMQGLFAPSRPSYSDEEIEAKLAAQNKPAEKPEMPKPRFSSPYEATPEQRAQNKKFGELIGKVTAAKLAPDQPGMFPEEEFMTVDAPEEEEEIDPDAYGLQEIARRHFKKD